MDEDVPNLRIIEGTSFSTIWEWRRVYREVVKRQKELQAEDDAMSGTDRGFSGINYELIMLNEILRISNDK